MKDNIKKHLGYYISLISLLLLGIFAVSQVSYDKRFQMAVIIITTFFYVIWGILHHKLHHNLNTKIVIEYILIGSLGLTIILFILKGAI
ncbi:MAG: hypothetical protein M1268_00320 [Patescibacteria group bacterium]|nr:hypothetical protein [Patescibacteria group bacterium]